MQKPITWRNGYESRRAQPYGDMVGAGYIWCVRPNWSKVLYVLMVKLFSVGFRLPVRLSIGVIALVSVVGCTSFQNGWLDPTVLGDFRASASGVSEIRESLSLEDTMAGIPGSIPPGPRDVVVYPIEFELSAGDTVAIEIYELRQRQQPFQVQSVISSMGYVNLPVVGRIHASGQTTPEFEASLVDALQERGVLVDPDVTVNPLVVQKATYSIFGIGVSASNNAPLRAGTFPIRRPDLRVLEAINQVGGLSEFVQDVYVFRYREPDWDAEEAASDSGSAANDRHPVAPHDDRGAVDAQPWATDPDSHTESDAHTGDMALNDDAPDGDASRQALIDAVVSDSHEPPPDDDAGVLAKHLEPDPAAPFIFKDGAFVANPSHGRVLAGDSLAAMAGAPDSIVPAANWARIAGDASYRVIHIRADDLRLGDPAMNVVVRAGDVIRIVSGEIGVYYVMGQVNRVGAFGFNAEPVTLKGAIAAAGGLAQLAWPDRCTIYRRVGSREQMIQIDLDRIFAGKDPDLSVRRGDIINVGTHPFAPFLRIIRGLSLPNPGTNIGYSFTYARNFADIDSFAPQANPRNFP